MMQTASFIYIVSTFALLRFGIYCIRSDYY